MNFLKTPAFLEFCRIFFPPKHWSFLCVGNTQNLFQLFRNIPLKFHFAPQIWLMWNYKLKKNIKAGHTKMHSCYNAEIRMLTHFLLPNHLLICKFVKLQEELWGVTAGWEEQPLGHFLPWANDIKKVLPTVVDFVEFVVNFSCTGLVACLDELVPHLL